MHRPASRPSWTRCGTKVVVIPRPTTDTSTPSRTSLPAATQRATTTSGAEVLSADMRPSKRPACSDPVTGQRFLREILEAGGSRPAMESFRAFRQRGPRIDALLRHQGMSAPAVWHALQSPKAGGPGRAGLFGPCIVRRSLAVRCLCLPSHFDLSHARAEPAASPTAAPDRLCGRLWRPGGRAVLVVGPDGRITYYRIVRRRPDVEAASCRCGLHCHPGGSRPARWSCGRRWPAFRSRCAPLPTVHPASRPTHAANASGIPHAEAHHRRRCRWRSLCSGSAAAAPCPRWLSDRR